MEIYEILKDKANNAKYRDKMFYFEIEEGRKYTFESVLKLVDYYVNIFNDLHLKNKVKYLIVDNSVDSVALFIALLHCCTLPVLINKDDLRSVEEKNESNLIELISKIDYCKLFDEYNYDYIIANHNQLFLDKKEEIYKLNKYIEKIDKNVIKKENGDFFVFTSGTTNQNGKLVPLRQNQIINSASVDDSLKSYSILTGISLASISGIIFDVIKPIIYNVENYMLFSPYLLENNSLANNKSKLLEYAANYHINRLFLPRDILDILTDDLKKMDFSSIETLYLSGEINSIQTINKMHEFLPNLKENVFVNLYGRTENNGVISYCREKKLLPLYIDAINSDENNLYYSFDKKTVFRLSRNIGQNVLERTHILFDERYYVSYIPVTECRYNNIIIDDRKVIGEISVDNIKTGDYGVYINNQLYIIGRKQDIVYKDNKQYILSMIEQLFSNLIGLKNSVVFYNNKIYMVFNYKLDQKKDDNYKQVFKLFKKCNYLINELNLPFEKPIFVSSTFFPKNKLLHKTKKAEMYDIISKKNNDVEDYNSLFLNTIKELINKKYNKKINVELKNNIFSFNKKEISIDELIDLENCDIGYTYFDETNDFYYFIIDDSILFGEYPVYNKINKLNCEIIKNNYYRLNKQDFIQFFNRIHSRKKNYSCLKIFGIVDIKGEFVTYKPFQLAANTNYYEIEKIFGKELPFNDYGGKNICMIYLNDAKEEFYSLQELELNIMKYAPLLYHTYQVKKDSYEFYIDGKKSAANNNYIYEYLIENYFNIQIKKCEEFAIYEKNDFFNDQLNFLNRLIIIDEQISKYFLYNFYSNFYNTFLYFDFNINGLKTRELMSFDEQVDYLIEKIISSCNSESINNLNDFGLMVIEEYDDLKMSNNDNMELFNTYQQNIIKRIYELITEIRKKGKQKFLINHNEIEIDLSKVKLAIISNNNINDLKYIFQIIDNCHIINLRDKSKIIKKVKK